MFGCEVKKTSPILRARFGGFSTNPKNTRERTRLPMQCNQTPLSFARDLDAPATHTHTQPWVLCTKAWTHSRGSASSTDLCLHDTHTTPNKKQDGHIPASSTSRPHNTPMTITTRTETLASPLYSRDKERGRWRRPTSTPPLLWSGADLLMPHLPSLPAHISIHPPHSRRHFIQRDSPAKRQ